MTARIVAGAGLTFAIALAVALSAVACGGRSDAPALADGADASASADSSDDALPPGVAYKAGGIDCCAKGIGRQCCSPGVPCGPYGGGLGECLPAGSGISAKDTCTFCCDGTNTILRMSLVDGKCVSTATHPEDQWICAACGDGVCNPDAHENVCNCPQDCP